LASGVGRIVRIVSEPEAEASDIGLTVSRRMKVLRLHGGVGRNRAKDTWDAIARLGTLTDALGVEAGLEPVASKCNPVGGHPVLGVGQRTGEIEWSRVGLGINASLEGIAAATAKPLREAPAGAAARERKADDRAGCYPVVQARSTACYPSGQIMTANYDWVAARPVVAAIARTPYAPAPFEQRTLVDGCSQHLGIGEHDVLRQLFALWCKANSTAAATPVHERIEHQPEEGCHHLKRWLLSAGRDLAREERQRTGEVAACQT